ncbi:hypothetical protein P4V86_10245 [Brevibacillus laterosporus]|uniref:Uncharacterized protein n=2 Tax=Brevibacillus TaxID=55080 RepID=A0AAP3DG14_BRELA|nr:hypothetical protein [Brevibacillus laterosporus]ATO48208.1 hypothetical protein BrL25_03215 [Brevibacillus laterosporus DSM 25]MBG9801872.1 hypothetical protein [Brevibacillus laterosporus]MCR8980271.1 hypothetical protein [Brevibacillus laterosporus]MCZ0807426.1 hypothetical protein [Brevibacillus laterosporus]MCZ0825862.1 hypothetical protein [Brevibacillus laterosporus]
MNGMELVEFLRETENKMMHIHRAIDHISNEPTLKESVAVLTEVITDYQSQTDKVKSTLRHMEVNSHQGKHQNEDNSY